MKILVTGSEGFVGKRLCAKLEALGHELHKIDLKLGSNVMIEPVHEGIDTVYHLAAIVSVQDSIENPLADAINSIMGTITLLTEYPNAKFIYSGSAAAKDVCSPYGLSKKTAAEYVKLLHKNYVICNFPNLFGEGGKGVVEQFLKDDKTIFINGDGLQTRTFVHVDDIVDGLIKAIEWNGEFDLGGKMLTVKAIAEATGKEVIYREALNGEIKSSKIENTTPDWKPSTKLLDYVKNYGIGKKIIKQLNLRGLQSVRHLEHEGVMYAIYITKGFKKMGWMCEHEGKYYGITSILLLGQKDDIIDYYLTVDKNAKETIEKLKSN